MRLLIALFVLPVYFVASASAQIQTLELNDPVQDAITEHRPLPVPPAHSRWEDFQRQFAKGHAHLRITMLDNPKHTEECQLLKIDTTAIKCGSSSKHARQFAKADVAKVLWHRHWDDDLWVPELFTSLGSAGLAYSTYLVAPILAASIPLGFFAFLFAVATIGMICAAVSTSDELVYEAAAPSSTPSHT